MFFMYEFRGNEFEFVGEQDLRSVGKITYEWMTSIICKALMAIAFLVLW